MLIMAYDDFLYNIFYVPRFFKKARERVFTHYGKKDKSGEKR